MEYDSLCLAADHGYLCLRKRFQVARTYEEQGGVFSRVVYRIVQ